MMKWIPAKIGVEGKRPEEMNGTQATCPRCSGIKWLLFTVGFHPQAHAQCIDCGAVFDVSSQARPEPVLFEPVVAAVEDTVYPDPDDRR